jgi:hypothetical protein
MTGIVILAAIIMGTFMLKDSGTHQSVANGDSRDDDDAARRLIPPPARIFP